MKGIAHFEDQDVGKKIIIKWILKKQGVGMWTEFIWRGKEVSSRLW
jgi:hypothetical protein